jgi:CRISPR/Cas system-associated exonuclease Cas4 (RecB family)
MMKRLIRFDRQRTPFTLRGLELRIDAEYALPDRDVALKIGGIIDRLDRKDGKLYIIDYKTGGSAKECRAIDDLYAQKANRAAHIFQTIVYASALIQQTKTQMPVVPQLLYIRQAHKEDYSPTVLYEKEPIADFHDLQTEFNPLLLNKIDDLFNPDIPFTQTEIASNCEYCAFKELCNR